MNTNINKQAKMIDNYGEEKILRKTRYGWQIKREEETPIIKLNRIISLHVGNRIKEERIKKGLTLVQLAIMSGINSGHPKARMWAIENNTRGEGIRFGTLYLMAIALGVDIFDLLPSKEEILQLVHIDIGAATTLNEPKIKKK